MVLQGSIIASTLRPQVPKEHQPWPHEPRQLQRCTPVRPWRRVRRLWAKDEGNQSGYDVWHGDIRGLGCHHLWIFSFHRPYDKLTAKQSVGTQLQVLQPHSEAFTEYMASSLTLRSTLDAKAQAEDEIKWNKHGSPWQRPETQQFKTIEVKGSSPSSFILTTFCGCHGGFWPVYPMLTKQLYQRQAWRWICRDTRFKGERVPIFVRVFDADIFCKWHWCGSNVEKWKYSNIQKMERKRKSAYWKNMIHFCVDILPGHHTKSREYCQVEEKKKAQVVTAKEEKFGKLRDRFVWHTSSQPNESKEYLLQNMAAKHHVLQ